MGNSAPLQCPPHLTQGLSGGGRIGWAGRIALFYVVVLIFFLIVIKYLKTSDGRDDHKLRYGEVIGAYTRFSLNAA